MSVVDGSCYVFHTLLWGDQAQGGTRVEVVEREAQEAAAAHFIHQQGLTLLKDVWGGGEHQMIENWCSYESVLDKAKA